jgi:hypothetical protein
VIKVTRLRIGNIARVANLKGRVTDLFSSNDHKIYFDFNPGHAYSPYDIDPVLLTAELLDKILINSKMEGEPVWFNGDDILIRKSDFSLFKYSECDDGVFYIKKLKYVHEFQNIYFTLAGTDINIDSF